MGIGKEDLDLIGELNSIMDASGVDRDAAGHISVDDRITKLAEILAEVVNRLPDEERERHPRCPACGQLIRKGIARR